MNRLRKDDVVALNAFFSALQNEVEIDIWRYEKLNVTPSKYSHAPRPTAWISKFKNLGFLFHFLYGTWILGGYYLFIQFKYFKSLLNLRKVPVKSANETHPKLLAVAFAPRSVEVINSFFADKVQYSLIYSPGVTQGEEEKRTSVIDLYSLINSNDLKKVRTLCVFSFKFFFKKIDPLWRLQLYTSFDWFLVYTALKNSRSDLVTAEHFDRFAVLMDNVAGAGKKELHLIQHGIVENPSEVGTEIRFNLPTRLNNVKYLNVYDVDSELFFRKNILSSDVIIKNVQYFSPKIQLSKHEFSHLPSILFVGNSICEQFHAEILKSLQKRYVFKAFYKPHPTEKITRRLKVQNWIIIEEKKYFPQVDFLISYPSTLVKEYGDLQIGAIVHPIDEIYEKAEHYVRIIENEFNSVLRVKNSNE